MVNAYYFVSETKIMRSVAAMTQKLCTRTYGASLHRLYISIKCGYTNKNVAGARFSKFGETYLGEVAPTQIGLTSLVMGFNPDRFSPHFTLRTYLWLV